MTKMVALSIYMYDNTIQNVRTIPFSVKMIHVSFDGHQALNE